MEGDDWDAHYDGFAKGDIAVFPGFFGSWEVWVRVAGEWDELKPALYAPWRGNRDVTIAEAMRLAEEWQRQEAGGVES